ncbi:hypothetical protein MTO96_006984 [Rhipicephalus appendiculatus]
MSSSRSSGETRIRGQQRSRSAGLTFPMARIHRMLRQRNHTEHFSACAAVYLASVLEYLTGKVLELAGNAARANNKGRINPRHLQQAIRNDDDLSRLLAGVTIGEGDVLPPLPPEPLAKASGKR